MTLYVLILMLLNISGAQDVRTVRHVSVREGKSIIIPCWYNHRYVDYVKYLSVGQFWSISTHVVSSDETVKYDTFSVQDDKTVNIFRVIMKNVQKSHAGTYWCGIEIPEYDVKEGFSLNVAKEISELYVKNQTLTGFEAGNVTISCHHNTARKMDKEWCKLGGGCMRRNSGTLNGASVEIRYYSELMMVTMSNLKKENTGWYWCSVREHQMPVHITVFKRRETITSSTIIETISEQPTSSSTVQFLTGRTVHFIGPFTPSQILHHSETHSLLWLMILGINLVLMVIICCIAVYLCKKKQNLPTNTGQRKQRSNTESLTLFTMCERQAEQSTDEDCEVTYATVELTDPSLNHGFIKLYCIHKGH